MELECIYSINRLPSNWLHFGENFSKPWKLPKFSLEIFAVFYVKNKNQKPKTKTKTKTKKTLKR